MGSLIMVIGVAISRLEIRLDVAHVLDIHAFLAARVTGTVRLRSRRGLVAEAIDQVRLAVFD